MERRLRDQGVFTIDARNLYQHPAYRSYPCDHCGKEYSAVHYLNAHQKVGCPSAKRSISELLQQTKALWQERKRRRTEKEQEERGCLIQNNPQGDPPVESTTPDIRPPPQPEPPVGTSSIPPTEDSSDLDVPVAQRKAKRQTRLPVRYRDDVLPQPPLAIEDGNRQDRQSSTALREASKPSLLPPALQTRRSQPNSFGVVRYCLLPKTSSITHDPDQLTTLQDLTESANPDAPHGEGSPNMGPFASHSAFFLAEWYWQSTSKSFIDFEKLVAIFRDGRFSLKDVVDVNWKSTFRILGANREDLSDEDGGWINDDGWRTTPISIDIPLHKRTNDPGIHSYVAGNFRHRSIMSVIRDTLCSPAAAPLFHYHPYKATWKPTSESPELELYGDLFMSRAFCEAHEALQNQPFTQENRGLERVIVALMFWSDSTQLTSFGGASLWPCYLFFGNESKYRRGQPSQRLGHQVAYFIKLPDKFNDYLAEKNGGKLPSDALFAYCTRELFHKQWGVLLDQELREAMKNGTIIRCPDGRRRCFYPRIFTYAADYPEKVLISGIRNNGLFPCHRCLVPKTDLWKMGGPIDTERLHSQRSQADQEATIRRARTAIRSGYAVDSEKHVEPLLLGQSLTPIENAFSPCRVQVNFDLLSALIVDILHEFEIGSWKKIYIHCLRLLKAFTGSSKIDLTAQLDTRYRSTPAFGKDTIRKFPLNASEMKRKAARDFEDLLQCAIPAFEGLLPEPHNTSLMTVLYVCAQWHALAKLRLHHDRTLDFLDYTTIQLGAVLRRFERDTCSKILTKELEKEAEARVRRNGNGCATPNPASLAVFTIKFHYLGDYTRIIRTYGTTDSYSTQTGELYHRMPKSWYPRTDKKDYPTQLSQIERRQARLTRMRDCFYSDDGTDAEDATPGSVSSFPDVPYTIGLNRNTPLSLNSFITPSQSTDWDESKYYSVGFITQLKQHLLPRVLEKMGYQGDIDILDQDQWPHVIVQENRIFSHRLLRINYTTYDVRRDQDLIHVDTPQCNVMLLNGNYTKETSQLEHQYLYGKVLGIFHADVSFVGALTGDGSHGVENRFRGFHRLDFIWIHSYQFHSSVNEFSLDRVSLTPVASVHAFNFVDPANIIRAVHLIPQFSAGPVDPPIPRPPLSTVDQESWHAYFVNRFADRDSFMRYQHGLSIGHTYMYSQNSPPPSPPPLIPPDFDHCLNLPNHETLQGEAPGSGIGHSMGDSLRDVEDSELAVFDDILENSE